MNQNRVPSRAISGHCCALTRWARLLRQIHWALLPWRVLLSVFLVLLRLLPLFLLLRLLAFLLLALVRVLLLMHRVRMLWKSDSVPRERRTSRHACGVKGRRSTGLVSVFLVILRLLPLFLLMRLLGFLLLAFVRVLLLMHRVRMLWKSDSVPRERRISRHASSVKGRRSAGCSRRPRRDVWSA
jgi:hypothetical protein